MNDRRFILSLAVVIAASHVAIPLLAAPRAELVRINAPADEIVWRDARAPYYGEVVRGEVVRYGEPQRSFVRLTEYEDDSQIIPTPQEGSPQYYNGGKDCCCGCCLVPVGGIESTFLFPVIDDATASVWVEDAVSLEFYSSSSVELDDNLFFSPRIWGGLEYCGWGVIGRLWWLGDSDSAFAPEDPFFPQSNVVKARLQAYTVDFEIYKHWCNCYGDQRQFAIGFRYANWEADELAEVHADAGTDLGQAFAQTHRAFDGPGFTLAYQGTKCCDCCACTKLFFSIRGSVLWGDITKQAQTTAWAVDPGVAGAAEDFSTAVAVTDDFAFIGEIQVGAQWEHQLACSCARVFVRTAVEYQYWTADAGFAQTGSLAFTDDIEVTALATAGDFEMNLVGFTVGTGFIW